MAKLKFKAAAEDQHVIELKAGTNRLGRAPGSDVCVEHPTVSGMHCEVVLGCGQMCVRDCGSTNGTFVDGTPVQEASLLPGQTLRIGDVELVVADTEIPVSIPRFDLPDLVPTTPIPRSDGSIPCRRHSFIATYRCPHCHELLCEECLHKLRRRGGKLLRLCPLCSYPVDEIGRPAKKRKSLLGRLRETTRMLFCRGNGRP